MPPAAMMCASGSATVASSSSRRRRRGSSASTLWAVALGSCWLFVTGLAPGHAYIHKEHSFAHSLKRAVVEQHAPYWEQPFSQPYFDNNTRRDTTTTVGQSAYLHCRVRNLGDRAVSWIRKRDLHILTVGILTYTNDQRFQSLHADGSDEWTLKIGSPQLRDSGTYECQVSTEPKISQAFKLNVVVSKAKILGNSELYIRSGSDINLTCVVLETPEPPSFIYWYQGGQVINYSQRGGISVVTEKQTRTSRLVIARAGPHDSGNYTCSPSSSDSASVFVHVLNGEHPAAMQHGNSSSGGASAAAAAASALHSLLVVALVLAVVGRAPLGLGGR